MPVSLYTGGVRSGKSSLALHNAASSHLPKKIFFATAVAFDDEMTNRIEKHKIERHEMRFETLESPYDLAEQISSVKELASVVVDCLTIWLSNQYYRHGEDDEQKVLSEVEKLVSVLAASKLELHVVTNELGWSIVPENAFARRFRDMAGLLNRKVAEISQNVTLCVCGIPVTIKPGK